MAVDRTSSCFSVRLAVVCKCVWCCCRGRGSGVLLQWCAVACVVVCVCSSTSIGCSDVLLGCLDVACGCRLCSSAVKITY